MKMSDVFDGDVVDINLFQDSCYIDTDEADYEIEDSEVKDRVIHAINNHDRMTDEIAELRDALERSNFAFQANLARVSVKCEQSMLEALERNKKLLNK